MEFAKEECTKVEPWQRMIALSSQIRKSIGSRKEYPVIFLSITTLASQVISPIHFKMAETSSSVAVSCFGRLNKLNKHIQ